MTLSDYTYLKQQIVYVAGVNTSFEEVLTTLKDLFKNDINSLRTYDDIKTIGQLLKVLEIRDVLSEDNVAPLKMIAHYFNDSSLLQKILEYEIDHKVGPLCNSYAHVKNKLTSKPADYSNINSNPYSQMSDSKRERIINTLCEEIGPFWRDLGRNLKMRECDIEEIENNYRKLSEKATELIKLYDKKKADPQKWFVHLCEALDKSRRKDLRKSLQEIMLMNI